MLLVEITVTKGLSELKMLDKRIRRKIEDAVLGGYSVGGKSWQDMTPRKISKEQ